MQVHDSPKLIGTYACSTAVCRTTKISAQAVGAYRESGEDEKLDDRIDGLRPGIDFLWSDWSEWFRTFNTEHGVLSDNVCCYVARGHL